MNIYQLNNSIKQIALNHPFVNEYAEGDIYEHLNSGEHLYGLAFLTIDSIDRDDDFESLKGSIFYVDRLMSDNSNKLQIQTTGIAALKQILNQLEDSYPDISIESESYTVFTEQFSDLCAGVFVGVTVKYQNIDTLCDSIVATNTLDIIHNGEYKVLGYESVNVNIPPTPLNPLTVTENGTYTPEEGGYSTVNVNVPITEPYLIAAVDNPNSFYFDLDYTPTYKTTVYVKYRNVCPREDKHSLIPIVFYRGESFPDLAIETAMTNTRYRIAQRYSTDYSPTYASLGLSSNDIIEMKYKCAFWSAMLSIKNSSGVWVDRSIESSLYLEDNDKVYVNGTRLSSSFTPYKVGICMYYGVKIYEDGVLVRDYVPHSSGKLYETFTDTYYEAKGYNYHNDREEVAATFLYGDSEETVTKMLSTYTTELVGDVEELAAEELQLVGEVEELESRVSELEEEVEKKTLPEGVSFAYSRFSVIPTVITDYCKDVTNVQACFMNCNSLTSADLDLPVAESMDYCFWYCRSLTSINLTGLSNVVNMYGCFYCCSSLTSVDLDLPVVENMNCCFYYCSSLTSINLTGLSSVEDYSFCFYRCTSLQDLYFDILPDIDLSNWGLSYCTALTVNSLMNVINALPTTTNSYICSIGSTNLAKLTDEQIAIATNKGWTLQ